MISSPSSSILVVAAHPDDEVLGCGGAIARHAAAGDRVTILILGVGALSRDPSAQDAKREILALRDAAKAAAKILGADVLFEELPDNRFDSVDLLDIIKRVERVKEQ